ncbi:amidase family protein [Novosphingobium jiangmenense]|uniref:Amidase n=1 Tax=Novosphingobium jiangmenense TaxID=2791981 RepID=A0ABS0HBB6_9SPHN|nr:amidase family protein [Novosphingobium jiangmenense]MBF9149582.1 amidase [Novosphingobium jiangmenense]
MAAVQESDLALARATDLVAMLRRGEIGAEELLDLHLARVAQVNPPINAVVALDVDRARAAARRFDAKSAQEASGLLGGLLGGLPMTVKETWGAQGMRTTVGLPFLADNVSAEDSQPVARLRAEGAVIFGKTNVPIGGADHQTANPIYGLTRNPWDLSRTVGGSSGGAAAALATGLTSLELGSDIGGSIRIPAHMCGLFGHKGSYGLIPTLGHVPPMPGVPVEPELSVAGPMARNAADLELGLDALTRAGPQVPASRHERLADFRVAIWTGELPYAASAETRAALDSLADALSATGATVSTTARPGFDPASSLETYLRSLFSIVLGGQDFRVGEPERATLGHDALWYADVLEQCASGAGPSIQALAQARMALKAAWRTFFQSWDVIVCPVFPTTAFEHDLSGEGIGAQLHRRRRFDGADHVYLSQLSWPSLATVADLPSTVVPVPRGVGELPLGLQLIGPAMEDRTPIRLAALLEAELGYRFRAPPALA